MLSAVAADAQRRRKRVGSPLDGGSGNSGGPNRKQIRIAPKWSANSASSFLPMLTAAQSNVIRCSLNPNSSTPISLSHSTPRQQQQRRKQQLQQAGNAVPDVRIYIESGDPNQQQTSYSDVSSASSASRQPLQATNDNAHPSFRTLLTSGRSGRSSADITESRQQQQAYTNSAQQQTTVGPVTKRAIPHRQRKPAASAGNYAALTSSGMVGTDKAQSSRIQQQHQQQLVQSGNSMHSRHGDSGLGTSLISSDVSISDFSLIDMLQQSVTPKPPALPTVAASNRNRRKSSLCKPKQVLAAHNHLGSESDVSDMNNTTGGGDDSFFTLTNREQTSSFNTLMANLESEFCGGDGGDRNDRHHASKTTPGKRSGAASKSNGGSGGSPLTSTPVRRLADSPSWLSPIRGSYTAHQSWLFSPPLDGRSLHDDDVTRHVSNQCMKGAELGGHVQQKAPARRRLSEPASTGKHRGHIASTVRSTSSAPGEDDRHVDADDEHCPAAGVITVTPKNSPKLGSLRSLGLVGLTPLKSPSSRRLLQLGGAAEGELSPLTGSSGLSGVVDSNHSFGKLLGELHLDSIMDDDGIGLDVSNMSFSHIKCDFD